MVEHGNDAYTGLSDEDYLVFGYRPYGNTTYTCALSIVRTG